MGENVCLRAAELDGTEAVVAGDARFQVGRPAVNVDGVYGFAADQVRSIIIGRLRSAPTSTQPVNNVFLSLKGQTAGSGHNHPLPDPVTTVTASTKDRKTVSVPYVSENAGRFPSTTVPLSTPSFFGPGNKVALGGPSKVAYQASDGVDWLEKRKPRGLPFPRNANILQHGTLVFGRVIQPDPASPERVGVLLFKTQRILGAARQRPRVTTLCLAAFGALARNPQSLSCNPIVQESGKPPQASTQLTKPLMIGSYFGTAVTVLTGLASDSVASVSLYLADGRVVKAALNENVFSVSASAAELPGKLVARDRQGRAIAISHVAGRAPVVVRRCPAAVIPHSSSPASTVLPWEKVDLGTLEVNGEPILGKTVQQVIAVLGKPTHLVRAAQIENGVSIPELLYGGRFDNRGFITKGGSPIWQGQAGLVIGFIKRGNKIVANDLRFTSRNLTDKRLGKLLQLQPTALQSQIRGAYGGYHLKRGYGSDPQVGCNGTFVSDTNLRGLVFGLSPYLPWHPYLTIEANAAAG